MVRVNKQFDLFHNEEFNTHAHAPTHRYTHTHTLYM